MKHHGQMTSETKSMVCGGAVEGMGFFPSTMPRARKRCAAQRAGGMRRWVASAGTTFSVTPFTKSFPEEGLVVSVRADQTTVSPACASQSVVSRLRTWSVRYQDG